MAKDYTQEYQQAKQAAQLAGEQWMSKAQIRFNVIDRGKVVGQMLDVCGNAYVQCRMTSSFAKWAKKKGYISHKWLHFGNPFDYRQELGLHEAMANAAKTSLETAGIQGLTIYSWID